MVLRRLEKYDILEEVGQGGMAKVFRGYDTALGREVAVKILHPHLAELRESKLRLQREAQAVDKERMTVTGQLLGSPAYMSPEHVEGKPLDFRTDVFSVGILLYQLATGELPFRGKNPHEVLKRISEARCVDARIVRPQVGER